MSSDFRCHLFSVGLKEGDVVPGTRLQRRCKRDITHGVVNLGRLRQFAAVATHLNITKAADELHLSQQAVSSAIRALERELGIELLARSGKRFRLTAAGEVVKDGASAILDAVKDLVVAARAASEGVAGRFTIVHTVEVSDGEIHDLVEALHAGFPGVRVTARRLLASELVPALRSGRADLAIRYGVGDDAGLDVAEIGQTSIQVALSGNHRLSDRTIISLADLSNETLLVSRDSEISEQLLWLCRVEGFEPDIAPTRIRGTAPTSELIDSEHFALVTEPPGFYHGNRVVVVPLAGCAAVSLQALWVRHADTPLHRAVVEGAE